MNAHEAAADAVHLSGLSYWVYVLSLANGKSYVGCTKDINERLVRHSKGYVSFTKSKLPFETICVIGFTDKFKTYEFEKYLKSGSGRAFMKKRIF